MTLLRQGPTEQVGTPATPAPAPIVVGATVAAAAREPDHPSRVAGKVDDSVTRAPPQRSARWWVVAVVATVLSVPVAVGIWALTRSTFPPVLTLTSAVGTSTREVTSAERSSPGKIAAAPRPAASTAAVSSAPPTASAVTTGSADPADIDEPTIDDSDEDVSVTTVAIRVHPDGSRILEGAEVVGGSKLVVQLQPGQKRVFEIQHDGYSARRLVVDGTKPEIRVGLVRRDGDGTSVSAATVKPPAGAEVPGAAPDTP